MKLHEYQSKRLFAKYGIPIPPGDIANTPAKARQVAQELGGRVVVKSQVLVGGRGKAGGIKLADNPDQAERIAAQILGMDIKGLVVGTVLIDAAANIENEIYLGVVIDRAARRAVIMASAEGGVEIEEVARTNPDAIAKAYIDPFLGVREYQTRNLAMNMGLEAKHWRAFHKITAGLAECFMANDASLAEINPLVVTAEGELLAVDGKMLIDDNSLFRHTDLAELRDVSEETPAESEARRYGLSYVDLDGEIGCMVNGAGLAMTTMDIIKLSGGNPANFLDIGGGAQSDKVAAALRIILSDSNVKAVLFNVFGGITRCDEVAAGILEALNQISTQVPMVARLVGTNAEEGRAMLAGANMITASTLKEAAEKAVAASKLN
ncbi:MAG: ADP-forming succinate--CoA ligase subunit beta [Anaerolineales bacterium]|nr:ADP-forming succinate--CoA ligase subunit beta [Anaerolineales bacterium]